MTWDGAFLPPMLAESAAGPFDDPGWRFEVKWDGWRALAARRDRLRVWSRRGRDLLAEFPSLRELEPALAPGMMVDGELVSVDEHGRPDFLGLKRRPPPRLLYVAFDLLVLEGGLLVAKPLEERLELLGNVLNPGPRLLVNDGVTGHGINFFRAVADAGLEGAIAKRLDSPYHPGRRVRTWLKLPAWSRVWLRIEETAARSGAVRLSLSDPSRPGAGPVARLEVPVAPPAGVSHVLVATRGRTPDGRLRHARVLGYQREDAP